MGTFPQHVRLSVTPRQALPHPVPTPGQNSAAPRAAAPAVRLPGKGRGGGIGGGGPSTGTGGRASSSFGWVSLLFLSTIASCGRTVVRCRILFYGRPITFLLLSHWGWPRQVTADTNKWVSCRTMSVSAILSPYF